MAQTPGLTAHRIWQWYERGVERHRMAGLYEKTEQAHRFFAGDQLGPAWRAAENCCPNRTLDRIHCGIQGGGRGQQYADHRLHTAGKRRPPTAPGGLAVPKADRLCRPAMGTAQNGQIVLERGKKDACIAGDSYLYFYDGDCRAQPVDTWNVHLADEQVPDLQQQEYILIAGRQTVGALRREARRYGLPGRGGAKNRAG